MKSGTVYFYQCVFRNSYFHSNTAQEPPTISFRWNTVNPDYLKTSTYRLPYLKSDWEGKPDAEKTFNQNNVAKWQLPSVFVDDSPPDGVISTGGKNKIATPYIRLGAGENATMLMQLPYIIFRNKRDAEYLITIGSGDTLRI